MTRQQFLTVRWNNLLVLGLGLPMLLYVAVVMATAAMPAGASFAGLMVIGVFY